MKKWIAFLVSVVMMASLALPAMAAESPGDLGIHDIDFQGETNNLPNGFSIAVVNGDDTAEVIALEAINAAAAEGEDKPNTAVEDTVSELIGYDPENEESSTQLTDEEKELLEALEDFEFITLPIPVVLTDGKEIRYTLDGTEDGEDVPYTMTAQIDALENVEDLTGYYILVINPVTHHFAVVPIRHADPNNPQNGVIIADLPMLGYVALIWGDIKTELKAEVESGSVKWIGGYIDSNSMWVEIVSIFNNAEKNSVADETVQKVNNPLIKETVQEAIADLLGVDLEDESSMEGLTDEQLAELAELADYDFVTVFSDAVLTDGTNQWFTLNGMSISAVITIKDDDLIGAADLSGYKLLLINPETNAYELLPLAEKASEFDPSTGAVKIELPFLGSMALIKAVDSVENASADVLATGVVE